MVKAVLGFSKKTKEEKIQWLADTYLANDATAVSTLSQYWNSNPKLQKLHDDFIENTITNYYLPFGIAPNFLINDQLYTLPMVIEESSVVAAASNAAKFWLDKGGFKAEVISTIKNGQVHINYFGTSALILNFFSEVKALLIASISSIEENMKKRGGGLLEISLVNSSEKLEGYYQLHCTFETKDAMGANFINTCLEEIAKTFENLAKEHQAFKDSSSFPEIALSILSNYVPECLVRAKVECPVSQLSTSEIEGQLFADKFLRAIDIAKTEPRRAVTHNKGIMNGIDALVLATGNDFRAVEAGVHAYASKEGHYSSLTHATIEDGIFTFWIEIPLALGTVGGLTSLHPLVKFALSILQKPSAAQLMQIVAVAGLAQNFAAIRSLVTTGIQKSIRKRKNS
jgi:hydroxymethylglutaryl-CoA reductase